MRHGTQAGYAASSDFAELSRAAAWTQEDVRAEMNSILSSRLFAKSVRLSRFLRFAVESLLNGKAEMLKEYTLGIEVYERRSSYDPTCDTIVRTEAVRLRSKLNEFYSSDRSSGAVTIRFIPGSYVPVITPRDRTCRDPKILIAAPMELRASDDLIRVAVSPFHSSSKDPAAQDAACDLTDEITYRLAQKSGLRIFRAPSIRDSDSPSQLRTWRKSGVDAVLHGRVRTYGTGMIATIYLATLSGMILWSQRFEFEPAGDSPADLYDNFADAIVNRLEGRIRNFPGRS